MPPTGRTHRPWRIRRTGPPPVRTSRSHHRRPLRIDGLDIFYREAGDADAPVAPAAWQRLPGLVAQCSRRPDPAVCRPRSASSRPTTRLSGLSRPHAGTGRASEYITFDNLNQHSVQGLVWSNLRLDAFLALRVDSGAPVGYRPRAASPRPGARARGAERHTPTERGPARVLGSDLGVLLGGRAPPGAPPRRASTRWSDAKSHALGRYEKGSCVSDGTPLLEPGGPGRWIRSGLDRSRNPDKSSWTSSTTTGPTWQLYPRVQVYFRE
jgi:hypothetical protein